MKVKFLTLFLTFASIVNAQQKSKIVYLDKTLSKEVKSKKATFKKTEKLLHDSLVNVQIIYLKNNCLVADKYFKNGKPYGIWITYTKDCEFLKRRDFSKLKYEEGDSIHSSKINYDSIINTKPPRFGDDKDDIFKYMANNVRFPPEAMEEGVSGRVYIKFIVKADGSVEAYSILSNVQPYLDYEAWELISNMPKWKYPGKYKGKPVDTFYTLPLNFRIR